MYQLADGQHQLLGQWAEPFAELFAELFDWFDGSVSESDQRVHHA